MDKIRWADIIGGLWDSQGDPQGPPGTPTGSPIVPERVSEELNDIRHVRYQFHSVFGTENKYKVAQPSGVYIRCPRGVPWASRVLWGSMKNLMTQGMLGINSTQFSALKTNTRLPNL